MKQTTILTVMSLLSIFLFTAHVADDIVRGIEKGGLPNLGTIPIAVLWLFGTLALAGKRSGIIIVLIFSFLGMGIPVLHMMGKGIGIGARLAKYPGHFFFVFTLLALGVTTMFSVILCVRTLWSMRRSEAR